MNSNYATKPELNGNEITQKHSKICDGVHLGFYKIENEFDQNKIKSKTEVTASGKQTVTWEYTQDDVCTYKPGLKEPITYKVTDKHIVTYPLGNMTAFYDFRYDEKSNLSWQKSPAHKIKYEYTPEGWLQSESIHDKIGYYEVQVKYDALGYVTAITLPDESSIEYVYKGPFVEKIIRKSSENNEYRRCCINRCR